MAELKFKKVQQGYECNGYIFTESGNIFNKDGKKLKLRKSDNRGLVVAFTARLTDGRAQRVKMSAAKLLFKLFHGREVKPGEKIAYRDGNPENISFSNLYVVDKIQRACTVETANEIRHRYRTSQHPINQHHQQDGDVSVRSLAKEYGLSKGTIQKILREELVECI